MFKFGSGRPFGTPQMSPKRPPFVRLASLRGALTRARARSLGRAANSLAKISDEILVKMVGPLLREHGSIRVV